MEIDIRAEELSKILEGLEEDVQIVSELPKLKKAEELSRIKDQMEKAKRDYKMVDMEARILPPEQKTKWKSRLKQFSKQMKSIEGELRWASGDGETVIEMGKDPRPTEDGVIKYGDHLMDDTDKAADNTIQMLNESEAIGIKVGTQLKEQTEQIQGMTDELYAIEDTIDRAMAIAKRMYRKVKTDKYIWMFVALILTCVILIIIVSSVSKKASNSDDSV